MVDNTKMGKDKKRRERRARDSLLDKKREVSAMEEKEAEVSLADNVHVEDMCVDKDENEIGDMKNPEEDMKEL